MDDKTLKAYIASNTVDYLATNGKTLDERLKSIELTTQQEKEMIKEQSLDVVAEKGLGLLGPIGEIASTIISWNKNIDENMKEAKQMILLEQYFHKVDNQENSINMLQNFLVNPQGNTIFNKILRILDDSPVDPELTEHLSTVLKKIVESRNFEELFEQHRYALGQIERLTPQAITIISDYRNWPFIQLGTSMSFGPKITTDFYSEFTHAYSNQKGITDPIKFERIKHSVFELQGLGLMEAFRVGDKKTKCELTTIGKDLLLYLE